MGTFGINPKIEIDNKRVNVYVNTHIQDLANFPPVVLDCSFIPNSHAGEDLFPLHLLFIKKHVFIYLAALHLSCSMRDRLCIVWDLSL